MRSEPVTVGLLRRKLSLSKPQVTLWLCQSLLITTILLSRFALPLGSKQIPLSWITATLHFVAIAALTGFSFDPYRFFAILVLLLLIVVESVLFHSSASPLSMIYVAGIYGPLALTMPSMDAQALRRVWSSFISLVTVIAICGLLQLAIQFVSRSTYLDPIQLLPEALQLGHYNTTYPIMRGSIEILKPNGIFLLEPSFYSQFVGLGLLGEALQSRRPGRLALLAVALIASFSGTGLLMVAIGFMAIVTLRLVLVFSVAVALVAIFLAMTGLDEVFVGRFLSITEPGSSGNARFIAPYEELLDSWHRTPGSWLVGEGAGSVSEITTIVEANFPPVAKVWYEYGSLGVTMFSLTWLGMFWGHAINRGLTVALFVFYFAASGALLQPSTVFPIWSLTGGFSRLSNQVRRFDAAEPVTL